jgi:hypothetical protein
MVKKRPDLSIVIVSLNIKDLLEKCLESVFKNKEDIDFEVFVVDNASKDGTDKMVEKKFPKVKLIKNNKNIGFGPANNIAMKKGRGRYVLLLNPDTEMIQEKILSKMISWMDKHPKVGISSCALLNPDRTYQGSGGYFPNLFRVFAWMFFLDDIPFVDRLIKPYHPLHPWSPFYKGENYFSKPHKQDWVTGAFFLIRREVLDEIGYFDEDFFAYVEEVEFCFRAKKAGWDIYYLPQWRILHYGQVTTGSEFAMINEFKGLKIFYAKHHPNWQMPILRGLLKAGSLLRIMLFGIIRGRSPIKIYAKAFKAV